MTLMQSRISTGNQIIRDGLVLWLDASNYPGSGTTWTDISGRNNNGTLTNGPTYSSNNSGSFVFDGVNDYVASSIAASVWQSNFTASFWVNFARLNTTGDSPADNTILQHGSPSTNSGLHLTQRNTRIWFGSYANDLSGTQTLTTNIWYHVTYSVNNTTFFKQIYLNGILDASGTGSGAYIGAGTNTRIGGVVLNFGSYFSGRISNTSIYNRVLSATEISQNFNALRGRYGI